MPDTSPTAPSDPTRDQGTLGDPVVSCDQNDVEAVCDLDEPNSIEIESEFEDEEPMGLLFTASAVEPGGETVILATTDADDAAHA